LRHNNIQMLEVLLYQPCLLSNAQPCGRTRPRHADGSLHSYPEWGLPLPLLRGSPGFPGRGGSRTPEGAPGRGQGPAARG